YDNDGFGEFVEGGAVLQCRGEQGRIHVPGAAFAVDEDGLGSEIANGIGGGGEGEGGAEDFVAGSDVEEAQAEVDGGGSAGQAEGLNSEAAREGVFEGFYIRAYGGNPVQDESLIGVRPFGSCHVGD